MMTSSSPTLPDAFLAEARSGLNGKRVVVTGATGFIGRRLVATLLDLGAQVEAILRTRHGEKALLEQGVTVVVGAISDRQFVTRVLKEKEILLHLAYDVRASGRENMAAFSTLFDAAQASDLERIVHMSSMVVYDHWPDGKIDDQASATRTGHEDYRDTKIEMEEALLAGAKPVAILQPGIVYGPGSAMWTDAPREALRRGPVILPDPIGICPAIHVDDLVQATLRAAFVPDLTHERFILNGPGEPTWGDFFQAHIAAIGTGSVVYEPVGDLEARLPPANAAAPASTSPSAAAKLSAWLRKLIGRQRFEALTKFARRVRPQSGPVYPDRASLMLYKSSPQIIDRSTRERLGFDPLIRMGAAE